MESKQLIYQNGHFYDKGTNSRITFKEGIEFSIIASSQNDFVTPEPAGRWPIHPISSDDLLNKIKKDYTNKYVKIFDKGSHLFFEISRDKKYTFKLELLEDLYIYKAVKDSKSEYKLYDCCCTTIENPSKNLLFFEEVYGKSLNDLFKSTYVHYFENKGNPASNAFITFYSIDVKSNKIYLDDFRKKLKSDDDANSQ